LAKTKSNNGNAMTNSIEPPFGSAQGKLQAQRARRKQPSASTVTHGCVQHDTIKEAISN